MARNARDPIDAVVGGNLARIRKTKGLSQTAIGEALGISFQQVQKYEKGLNRVSASVLYHLSQALSVSMDDFFKGAETIERDTISLQATGRVYFAGDLNRVKNAGVRKALASLIKSVSTEVEAITEPEREISDDDPLLAYSKGLLSSREAVHRLGLRDYADLLVALGDADLPMQLPPSYEIENQAATFALEEGMKRCTIILPEAGPINSLWVADRLDLLLELDMRIVIVDAVYDELTSDLSCLKDAEVKDFIDSNSPPFVIERTDIGETEREKRRLGQKLKKNAGELAMVDFLSDEGGLERYLESGEPVAILFEDPGLKVFNRPPNLHLISTVGLLRGLEEVGIIASAADVIGELLHPSKPGRRPEDARKFTDLLRK